MDGEREDGKRGGERVTRNGETRVDRPSASIRAINTSSVVSASSWYVGAIDLHTVSPQYMRKGHPSMQKRDHTRAPGLSADQDVSGSLYAKVEVEVSRTHGEKLDEDGLAASDGVIEVVGREI